jgi:3-oxoacyl-[acyl-carrier protein] reductase
MHHVHPTILETRAWQWADEAACASFAQRLARHPAHRFGRPDELGRTCAFLCSVHAGSINGQNILMDGGSFPGTF